MKLRNAILVGLVLSVTTIILTFGNVLPNFPGFLVLLSAVVLWYGYVAICRTRRETLEDAAVLRQGLRWGLAIACAYAVMLLVTLSPETFVFPAVALGLLLPFAAGASGAIRSGRTFTGSRVGFWSGMIGGLLGFFVLAVGSVQLASYALVIYGPIFSPIAATIGGWVGIRLARTGELGPESSIFRRTSLSQ